MKPNRPEDDALNPSVWWFNGPGRGTRGGVSFLFFLRLVWWKLVEFDGQLEVQRWILTDGSLRTLLLCEKKKGGVIDCSSRSRPEDLQTYYLCG